ncbi:MAG: cupredoxin domain-containing protein, partial [Candidatus Limnocylindrales bacterium]
MHRKTIMRAPIRRSDGMRRGLARILLLGILAAALCPAACDEPTGAASGSPLSTVTLVAENLAFDKPVLRVPAGVVVAITLDNRDPGILHDVAIFASGASDPLFRSLTFAGIASQTFALGPLAAGSYRFVCDVHPGMTGTLIVGDGSG